MRETYEEIIVRREVDHLTVIGRLPDTPWRPSGGISITLGDSTIPTHMWPDQAARLAEALLEVNAELSAASDDRYGGLDEHRSAIRNAI